MEGKLEVIIYIIAMILGLGATAYRNYSKQKEMNRRKAIPPQADKSEFDSIFDVEEDTEEDYYDETFRETEMKTVNLEEILVEQEVEEPLETQSKPDETEGNAVFKTTEETLLSDEVLDYDFRIPDLTIKDEIGKEIQDDENAFKTIDWEEAIIYSEILKKKY